MALRGCRRRAPTCGASPVPWPGVFGAHGTRQPSRAYSADSRRRGPKAIACPRWRGGPGRPASRHARPGAARPACPGARSGVQGARRGGTQTARISACLSRPANIVYRQAANLLGSAAQRGARFWPQTIPGGQKRKLTAFISEPWKSSDVMCRDHGHWHASCSKLVIHRSCREKGGAFFIG